MTGLVASLPQPALAEPPASPTAAALQAYAQGQAYERLFEDHVQPGTCGIVLERPQCRADFETIHALRGADEFDGAMETWLATGETASAVKGYNGMYVPDKAWDASPEFAWWYSAGKISIASDLPEDAATTVYLLHVPDVFASHVDATPAAFRGLIDASGSPFARLKRFRAALAEAVPVVAFPSMARAAETQGDAQLGIYATTLEELVDNPFALSRPESRQFGLAVLRRLQEINDRYGNAVSLSGAVAALSGQIPSDPRVLDSVLRQPVGSAISQKWPLERRQAYLLGGLTAQVAYNAAVLRDAQSDAAFRRVISTLPPYSGMSPTVQADLTALAKIPDVAKGGNWSDINAAASRAVAEMLALA
jgi:hypothetical protein